MVFATVFHIGVLITSVLRLVVVILLHVKRRKVLVLCSSTRGWLSYAQMLGWKWAKINLSQLGLALLTLML